MAESNHIITKYYGAPPSPEKDSWKKKIENWGAFTSIPKETCDCKTFITLKRKLRNSLCSYIF